IIETPAAAQKPTTSPTERSNSPRTRISVTPTASTHNTEALSRIARAFAHAMNVLGRAAEKTAAAARKALIRLQRSAATRSDNFRWTRTAVSVPAAFTDTDIRRPVRDRASTSLDVELLPLRQERRDHLARRERVAGACIRLVDDHVPVRILLRRRLGDRCALRPVLRELVDREDPTELVGADLDDDTARLCQLHG